MKDAETIVERMFSFNVKLGKRTLRKKDADDIIGYLRKMDPEAAAEIKPALYLAVMICSKTKTDKELRRLLRKVEEKDDEISRGVAKEARRYIKEAKKGEEEREKKSWFRNL